MIPLFSFNAKPLHMELYSLLEIMSYCQGGWVDELCEPVLPSTATTILPLAVEEHCGNRWPEVVKCCKVSCVEVLSPSRRINCLPNILSEEHKHNAMNPCCWPRVLVADYFISWKLEGKAKLLRFISESERWVYIYIYISVSSVTYQTSHLLIPVYLSPTWKVIAQVITLFSYMNQMNASRKKSPNILS